MKTLAEIENCGKTMLIPADVAEYLGADPQSIRLQARANAAALEDWTKEEPDAED